MKKESVIQIEQLVKKFPIGGDYFTALNKLI